MGGEEHSQMAEDMLVRVEGVLQKMQSLENCRVALPRSVFWPRIRRMVEEGEETYSQRAMWRNLLPKEDAGGIAGYWICEGVDDSEYVSSTVLPVEC